MINQPREALQEHWSTICLNNRSQDSSLSAQHLLEWVRTVYDATANQSRIHISHLGQSMQDYKSEFDKNDQFSFEEATKFLHWLSEKQAIPKGKYSSEGEASVQDNELKQRKTEGNESHLVYPIYSHTEVEDTNEFNEFNRQIVKTETNLEADDVVSSHYRHFLHIVFDHYCRMSSATDNDPTFEQIQRKIQVLTINKFMMFCREFGVIKLNAMNRTWLIETFKKNAYLFKEMNFQQFIQVLLKISHTVYKRDEDMAAEQKSKQFERLLVFLELNNAAAFRKKMNSLGISYKRKTSENSIQKIVLNNYSFKYSKSPKKQALSRQKQDESQKSNLNKKASLNIKKRNLSLKGIFKYDYVRGNLESSAARKEGNKKIGKLQKPPLPLKKEIERKLEHNYGYAEIHRIKINKQFNSHHNSKLRLNKIVEEAKKIIENRNSGVQKSGTPYTKMSVKLLSHQQKSQSDHRIQKKLGMRESGKDRQLQGLLDEDSDDEFLSEHLNREKANGRFNRQIIKKIEQIGND